MYYSFFHCYINGNAFLFHWYFSEIPLFLRQIGMHFIYETCNKYLHLNCHHFKKKNSILYFCKCNNLSCKFQFGNYISLVCDNLSLEKHIAPQEKSLLLWNFEKQWTFWFYSNRSVVLISHVYWVSLKYGRNPLATNYAPLLFPFFFLQLNKPLL